jgi:hypothetical protein
MTKSRLPKEMRDYIEKIHQDKYNVFSNNCIDATQKLAAKAKSLGLPYRIISCTDAYDGVSRISMTDFVVPHVFIEIDGEEIDVAADPETEAMADALLGKSKKLSRTVIGEFGYEDDVQDIGFPLKKKK